MDNANIHHAALFKLNSKLDFVLKPSPRGDMYAIGVGNSDVARAKQWALKPEDSMVGE